MSKATAASNRMECPWDPLDRAATAPVTSTRDMTRNTRKSARRVRTAIAVRTYSGARPATVGPFFRDLPGDVVGEVLRHLRPGTARLVSKRQRDTSDSARSSLEVGGVGRHGQPALVAGRCPNLTDLTIRIRSHHLAELYVHDARALSGLGMGKTPPAMEEGDACIPWETYVQRATAGMFAWADACVSLRHLRHLHLDIQPVLGLLPAPTQQSLWERFLQGQSLREVSVGDWTKIRARPALFKIPIAELRRRGLAPENPSPILGLLTSGEEGPPAPKI